MAMSFPLHIERLLRINGVLLDEDQKFRLGRYVDLLTGWNKRINLVSRRDSANIWESHILHSLSPLFLLQMPGGVSLLDLGSGGGLPGIPLAIVLRGVEITLLDATQKKVHALREMVTDLQLGSVRVVGGRAEELGKLESFAHSFDAVIARSVAPLHDLVQWSRPFLRLNATAVMGCRGAGPTSLFSFPYLLAMKGGDLQRELRDARLRARGETITEINLVFPGSENLGLVDKKLIIVEFARR
jgi:16S rRNA (guanine527-N7)-methyltransferase